MKILVLGGTGFLGPHEIDQFEDRDWEITIFNRGRSKTDLFDSDFAKVTRLTGDRDPDQGDGLAAIEEAIKSGTTWDAVVDNSAYVPRIAKASAELRCAQADLTKAKGRLSFAIAVANRLLDKEIDR